MGGTAGRHVKLPPDDSNDITPCESFIQTINVSELPTKDLGNLKTAVIDHRVTLATLVRARLGARASAFDECNRKCRIIYLSWRRGMITGAALMAGGLATALAAVWSWVKWGR